jgi:hypothetical protein
LGTGWLISKSARIVFSCSAWVVVGFVLLLLCLQTPWLHRQFAVTPMEDQLVWIFAITVTTSIMLAVVIITVGVAIFCVLGKRASVGRKILWLVLFFFTAPLGPAFYYFAVYRKLTSTHPEVMNA